ncbi:pyridine nucleotide-disulfide oxidoreductase [Halomicronema hongdechloris C2206]|uniref:Pyridine nucleotide-disulfide oxidoreductase n=1 Tax=Halomicronema hongdechloris C2206 TaxID=1641165 RepID=A0A1Z3HKV5_9CYAN|nr:NAD(P)/FAD-dependent oxidoreductase [Halomicronema hongdechloris]ASC70930.1 pyridine nucleotide-disulfide oxidoreductase [Halomicronema hongdechloris C2206]
MAVDYDLVVIGGGSAGLVAASAGAQLKARVALVEKAGRLGGDCLHYGCVPSKSLIHASRVAHQIRQSAQFGIEVQLQDIRFQEALGHVHRVIDIIQEHDSTERFQSLGVEVIYGTGQFSDRRTFTVNGRQLQARAFLIATGSHPSLPPIDGLTEAGYLTNETVFYIQDQPRSLAVIGAGPIGCELGQAFARLGSEVTLIASRAQILPKEDPDAAAVVQRQMEADGVRILTQSRAQRVEVKDGKKHIWVGGQTIVVDEILLSTGQVPNVESLNLQAAEVAVGKRGITVNGKLQTTNPRIYAAGDVIGGYQFTHVAGYEAAVALQNALLLPLKKADYRVIPWATFTDPELARVGLSEAQARQRYGDDIYVLQQDFSGVDRALAEAAGIGFAKVLTRRNGEILGAHIVGPAAGELIHEVVMAMSYKLKVGALKSIIHVYPTLAEVNSKAALQLTKQTYAKNTTLQGILTKVFNFLRRIS